MAGSWIRPELCVEAEIIRPIRQDPDGISIILEPLNNWTGMAEALGGQQFTVGGTLGLNPSRSN